MAPLRRQLSPFISRMWTWWVRRSSSAPVRRSGPNTSVHSSNGRLGGDQDRATLVALAEHLEQQLSAGLGQRHETECVDDQELVAGEPLLESEELFLVARLDQLMNQRGGGGEADREALLAGR